MFFLTFLLGVCFFFLSSNLGESCICFMMSQIAPSSLIMVIVNRGLGGCLVVVCHQASQQQITMAKTSLLSLLLVACLAHVVSSFMVPQTRLNAVATKRISQKRSSRTMVMAEKQYWEGEWVCADCGYIYDKDSFNGKYFEDQTAGFKCPQCSGPRRRFAKKVGDKIGITRDGGDLPIVLFSLLGGLGVIAFGIYMAGQ